MKILKVLILTLCLGVVANPQLHAQELTDDEAEEAIAFAVGNATFVLLHEIGHMLIDQFDIPILGREEDAVDNLATLLLLWQETDAADQALIDAAYGWFLADASQTDDFQDSDFYGEHSLDLQRGYSIICKLVGYDPKLFGDVAEDAEIEVERREACAFEFAQIERSWARVLEPHLAEQEGASEGRKISVAHDPVEDDEVAYAADLLTSSEVMEVWAKVVEADFRLPNEVAFRSASCGEANAFYDPEAVEVVMCHELVAVFADLIVEDIYERRE